jgi:glycine betaine/choline ABC-type transport system substrate-binding protein
VDRTKAVGGLIAAALLAGCARGPRPVVVGSKNFTEQVILGEIVAQQIENKLHERVERRLNLGGTLLAHQSLAAGQIDLYPEYTGTALTVILKLPPDSDPDAVYTRVENEYANQHLVWMPPLGFDNTFAMVVRGPDARSKNLATMTDAESWSPGWTLGIGYEFMERPDGFPALMKTYHLPIDGSPRTMDLGLLYRALEQKQVSMVAGNRTDGLLSSLDVKVLADDQHAFPPYQAAYVVRADALAARPGLRDAIGGLSGKISAEAMQKLNYAVDVSHKPVPETAREFLRAAGL